MPKTAPQFSKLTTILFVPEIEPCLAPWLAAGYEVTVKVPEAGPLDFVILHSASGELMLQTNTSLSTDLPSVARVAPGYALYADVVSLTNAKALLTAKNVLVERRKTFYGATESWLELEGGVILGLSEHPR